MAKAAGESSGWVALAALGLAAALWPVACTAPEGGTDTGIASGVAVQAVLDAVGPSVVLPALDDYGTSLLALNIALSEWDSSGDRAGARVAFQEAMRSWQVVDVLRVSPAVETDPLLLRDESYSWPLDNPCRVDQVTAAGDFSLGVGDLLVNARGLDALEYLLYADPNNACPSRIPPNSDGTWAALSELELQAERAAYGVAIGQQLRDDLAVIYAAWENPSVASLQAILDGVFSLESVIKDRKLGHPLGIVDCSGVDCIDDVEGGGDSASTEWLVSNLLGVQTLFSGGDAAGLDDLLLERGYADVVTEWNTLSERAVSQARALDPNLAIAIVQDRSAVLELYETVDAIDEVLRIDITTLLLLELPDVIRGDTD